MSQGGGKYGELADYVREKAEASGAAVMVFGGHSGNGFSVAAGAPVLAAMPSILRSMADQIEADNLRIMGAGVN